MMGYHRFCKIVNQNQYWKVVVINNSVKNVFKFFFLKTQLAIDNGSVSLTTVTVDDFKFCKHIKSKTFNNKLFHLFITFLHFKLNSLFHLSSFSKMHHNNAHKCNGINYGRIAYTLQADFQTLSSTLFLLTISVPSAFYLVSCCSCAPYKTVRKTTIMHLVFLSQWSVGIVWIKFPCAWFNWVRFSS